MLGLQSLNVKALGKHDRATRPGLRGLLHDQDTLPGGGLQVHVVHAGASPAHHLQLLCRVDDISSHLGGRADNKAFAVLRQKKEHVSPQSGCGRPQPLRPQAEVLPAGRLWT